MTAEAVIGAATLGLGVIGWLIGTVWKLGTFSGRLSTLSSRLESVESQLVSMMRDLAFASTVSAAKLLHREDNAHDVDELVDRFLWGSITDHELQVFRERLTAIESDTALSELQRQAARILLQRVRERYSIPADLVNGGSDPC